MKSSDNERLLRSALEDIDQELPPDLRADLHPDQLSNYDKHAFLDKNLGAAFTELSSKVDSRMSAEEVFKHRLLQNIKHAALPGNQAKDKAFLRRLSIQGIIASLRERFFTNPQGVYRLAPALLVLLIALPAVPLLLDLNQSGISQDKSSGETASELTLADKAPPALSAPGAGMSAEENTTRAFKKEGKDTKSDRNINKRKSTSEDEFKNLASPGPGNNMPDAPVEMKKQDQSLSPEFAAKEKALQDKLKNAKTNGERRVILKKLEALYKSAGDKFAAKLKAVRKQKSALPE